MHKFFFTICIIFFFGISCVNNNKKKTSSPLKTFHYFLQIKNNIKSEKLYNLLEKDSTSQRFFKDWIQYTKQARDIDILKIKKSSCIVFSVQLKDTVKIVFRENFIRDTCLIYLLKRKDIWKISVKKYPSMVNK